MSTFNNMPGWARRYCSIMAVIALFSAVIFGGRLFLDGTIFANETKAVELVKAPEGDVEVAQAQKPAEIDLSSFVADVDKGKKISGKCKACHTFKADGKNLTGPNLWGIYGQDIAAIDGFRYSSAFEAEKGNIKWTDEALNEFIKKPKKYIPKTKMSFAGIRKETDRLHLIAWLKTLK